MPVQAAAFEAQTPIAHSVITATKFRVFISQPLTIWSKAAAPPATGGTAPPPSRTSIGQAAIQGPIVVRASRLHSAAETAAPQDSQPALGQPLTSIGQRPVRSTPANSSYQGFVTKRIGQGWKLVCAAHGSFFGMSHLGHTFTETHGGRCDRRAFAKCRCARRWERPTARWELAAGHLGRC